MTYRPRPGLRRLLLDVEADVLDVQRGGATLVLLQYRLMVLDPRLVVVLRLLASEAVVECLCRAELLSGSVDGVPVHGAPVHRASEGPRSLG